MNKLYIALIIAFFSLNINFTNAQSKIDTAKFNQLIDPNDFNSELFKEIFLYQYNQYRIKNDLDSINENRILTHAAEDQAKYMAEKEEKTLEQGGKKKTTGQRVEYYGGSNYATELVNKIAIKKGKDQLKYKDIIEAMLFKWTNNNKTRAILENKDYIFIGIDSKSDLNAKKAYISIVLGNYKTFNKGAELKEQLAVPFSTKKYGLKPYENKSCKKCKNFKNIEDLQSKIYVKNGLIYFKYNNLKRLKKLLSGSKDGLAIDIVQKEQYNCGKENIIDNTLVNKGIMVKRIWIKKMIKKNLITNSKEKRKKIEVVIGKWPKGLNPDGDYELNLMIIKDKHVCRNINKTYLAKGSLEYSDNTWFLPDTATFAGIESYIPKAEESDLSFRIPFEKNKSNYNPEDIKPFLDALNEPDFVVDNLTIAAYSSIEGNVEGNKKLQKKRAESIVEALKKMQNGKEIEKAITTDDSWEDFKNSVQGTKYEDMALKSKSEAQSYIKENDLNGKLEFLLKDQRYAQMNMHITYEIKGEKEQDYVVSRFNKAARSCDRDNALLIQKYIFGKVINEEYDENAVFDMVIDSTNAECVGLLMNKLWLEKFVNEEDVDDETCAKVNLYYDMAPTNPYLVFNKYFCEIENGVYNSVPKADIMQNKINELYNSALSKELVDNLNLEFQFILMSTNDTLDVPTQIVLESLQRIKDIVSVEDANWQSSLKLAYIFIDHHDYDYSAKLLEPFIYDDNVYDELLYTYISLCSYSTYRMMSNRFVTAMEKAKNSDPKRFCKLFKGDKFSIQVLENTLVKDMYCNTCK
jgi:uncharacterized protein YkwD